MAAGSRDVPNLPASEIDPLLGEALKSQLRRERGED